MTPTNPAFSGVVNIQRREFYSLLRRAKIERGAVYPSKHFFERLVERNLDVFVDRAAWEAAAEDLHQQGYEFSALEVKPAKVAKVFKLITE